MQLDLHIRATGQQTSLWVFSEQLTGMLYVASAVIAFNIVHDYSLMSPARTNSLNSVLGVIGKVLIATPVAMRIAFLIAGAGEIIGGSPSALCPYADCGS